MTFHPRERRTSGWPTRQRAFGRRDFLRLSAYGAATAGAMPTFLAACAGDDDGGGGGAAGGGGGDGDESPDTVKRSRPDDPATLPMFDDIAAIDSGLEPESGTLKVINYEEYINPAVLKAFRKKYGVKVEVTTYTSMDEGVAKLSSGQTQFDVVFATTDVVAKLATGRILQPLNHDYLPHLKNVWAPLRDPFYDKGSVYTVPYTLFTTGVGYRNDGVAKKPQDYDNPYDIYWDSANSGQVFVLEDDREVFGMALLRQGKTDVNTENPDDIAAALDDVLELTDTVKVKVGAQAYTVLPENRAHVHQCWSGDVVNAQYYLPEGQSIDDISYWYPADSGGVIGSDTITVMNGAEHPVLAHLFLDYLLDNKVSLKNYGWLGYQPPLDVIEPDALVKDEYVPPHLSPAIIRQEDFEKGHQLLQLSLAGEKLWDDAWSRFTAGG